MHYVITSRALRKVGVTRYHGNGDIHSLSLSLSLSLFLFLGVPVH